MPVNNSVMKVGLGQALAWASSAYTIAVLAKPMAQQFSLALWQVYAMYSGGLVLAALLGPTIGRSIDKHGGRRALMASNILLAVAHLVMASALHPAQIAVGWVLICLSMPMGLYEAAFATLISLKEKNLRGAFSVVTLIAGLASALSWPFGAYLESHIGWRATCVVWALLHLTAGHWLHVSLPKAERASPLPQQQDTGPRPALPPGFMLLTTAFACIGFLYSSMAAHLPRLLELNGVAPALAIGTASLFGFAQIGGRLLDMAVLKRLHPLPLARLCFSSMAIGGFLLLVAGPALASTFTILHGLGLGLLTICKGLLPITLFGDKDFGRLTASLDSPARFLVAFTPLVFGFAMDSIGNYALALYMLVAAAGATACFKLKAPAKALPPAA